MKLSTHKRILLLYITEVSGHHQATLAIEKSLRILDPTVEVMNINGFGYTYPIIEKIVNKTYMGIIKRTPHIWDYLYDNPKIYKKTLSIKKAIHQSNHTKFAKLFKEFQPDAVICTQAFPCGMVADYKNTHQLSTKVIAVLTDYAPHAYWLHEGVDYYVVPSEDAKGRFIKEGVQQARIKIFGIPVDPKFIVHLDRKVILRKLGLDEDTPRILVMGGGQGLGPIKKVLKELMELRIKVQFIVVTGTNKKLLKWLKQISPEGQQRLIVFEYVHNMEEIMDVSTIAITKPGGMTTTECLTKGLPMVIIRPLPGQEMYNTNFLLSKGAAIRINEIKYIGAEVGALLNSQERLMHMRRCALENNQPNSSFDIAKLALQ